MEETRGGAHTRNEIVSEREGVVYGRWGHNGELEQFIHGLFEKDQRRTVLRDVYVVPLPDLR
jgi:hypothetical protein